MNRRRICYEECCLLGCVAVWLLQEPTLQSNLHYQGEMNQRTSNNISSNYQLWFTAKKYYEKGSNRMEYTP
jgi:hypothetical protein